MRKIGWREKKVNIKNYYSNSGDFSLMKLIQRWNVKIAKDTATGKEIAQMKQRDSLAFYAVRTLMIHSHAMLKCALSAIK